MLRVAQPAITLVVPRAAFRPLPGESAHVTQDDDPVVGVPGAEALPRFRCGRIHEVNKHCARFSRKNLYLEMVGLVAPCCHGCLLAFIANEPLLLIEARW